MPTRSCFSTFSGSFSRCDPVLLALATPLVETATGLALLPPVLAPAPDLDLVCLGCSSSSSSTEQSNSEWECELTLPVLMCHGCLVWTDKNDLLAAAAIKRVNIL